MTGPTRIAGGMPQAPLPGILRDPVRWIGGVCHLDLPSGAALLRDENGQPVRDLGPGWTPRLLHAGFEAVMVLELDGPSGARESWLIGPGPCRLGRALSDLSPALAQRLREEAAPLLLGIAGETLLPPLPRLPRDPAMLAFLELGRPLRQALAEAVAPAASVLLAAEIGAETPLVRFHLQAGFSVPLQDRLVATTGGAPLQWPSPVDGRLLPAQGCLFLDDFRLAYRFADPQHDLVFYLIASDHHCRVLGLYLPARNLLVARDGWSRHLLDQYFPHGVASAIAGHAVAWAAELVPALIEGPRRIAGVLRGPPGTHIGHQLWNELTGIERMLREAAGPAIPDWIVPRADQGTELWGPVDRLFPDLQGRVCRHLDDDAAIAAHLYANRLCAARITAEHVSTALRGRLLAGVDRAPARARLRLLRSLSGIDPRDPAPPVVVLGLRVENRTLVDLAGFCIRLATMLAESWPGAVLVLDGHNRRLPSGDVIASHGEALAATAPVEVEREIAAQVRAATAGLDLHVEDTIGAELGHSLAWSLLSDCFVSIWGASLAKYRWACNRPGLVISSRANLLHRTDLRIYDAPETLQAPTRMLLADPACVTDRPGAPLLVPVGNGNPFFANFQVDEDAVFDQVRAMVWEALTEAAPPPAGTSRRQPALAELSYA